MPSKKNQKKTPAKKSAKSEVFKKATKKPKAKKVVAKVVVAKSKKNKLSRFNVVQQILSQYLKDSKKKVGLLGFQKLASTLYAKTKDVPLKYIEQNIEQLYKEHLERDEMPKEFPDNIPFYLINQTLQSPKFDKAQISYYFNDGIEEYDAKGDRDDVYEQFRTSGLYQYLRRNYNGSPPNNAVFIITDTDNETFVKYKVETFSPPESEGKPQTSPTTPPIPKGGSPFTAEEIIAIEREKQKTLKQVSKLLKQGVSMEQIERLLGK